MGVVTIAELKTGLSGKRSFRPNSSTRHATEWPISDVSSDLKIEIGASSFSLHKFPLVSRSGRIRKLLADVKDAKITRINLSSVPGGPEAFELAAKFCYGINVEITLSNIAALRCVSHFLEMGEKVAEKNLEAHTEAYLKDVVLLNISSTITVLHHCESLLPISEEINLVNRLIDAIANNACKEQLTSGLLKLDHNFPLKATSNMEPETPYDWWGKSLAVLNLDFFQRVLLAIKSKGLRQDMICKILINYTQNSLQSLVVKDHHLVKGSLLEMELQKKQRIIVEAIDSLLPTQARKSPVPIAYLSSLLKTAIASSVSTSCRSDLERRTSLQLDQAILEDILIPVNSHGNNHTATYDTESVLRIFSIFLNLSDEDDDEDNPLRDESGMAYDFDGPGSPKQSSILKVSNDGLYRAVDLFLEVHSNMKDSERVIFRTNQASGRDEHNQFFFSAINGQFPQRSGSGAGSGAISPRDNYASVRRENRDLKLEVARMRMRLTDLENDHVSMKQELVRSHPANKIFKSFTKKLSKLNSLFRINNLRPLGGKSNSESRLFFKGEGATRQVCPEPTYESLDGMAHATRARAKHHHRPVCNHHYNHFHVNTEE
ncbi:BTB/POZ domain-containing protein SETH6 [Hibiscus syriacus]|uniref:BTB/POZ domain-containing protein SETH6 n=1 Tax=Hibiscus syriacus TaxID=106335 RepID=A0A6A2XAQ9_HIBSY|nr:BTB/POZ domain-containing protein SETH6 [Hibiscus syriacus]